MPRPEAISSREPRGVLFLLLVLAATLAQAIDSHVDSDDSELEAIPFEDAYDLLTELDFRPFNPADPEQRTYGVIVDCGSSGTRAHIYEWDSALEYEQLLHDIEPMREPNTRKPVSRKFSPSLASFADDPNEKIEEYFKGVLDYVETKIPRAKHPFTGVYILATAGMRLLDEESQDRIMGVASEFIKHNYMFAKVKTSVISGADEGMYQWISVNAKAKRFLGQDTNGRTKTFAVIEMGGASIQVTYQLRPGVRELTSSLLSSESARKAYEGQVVEPKLSRHDKPENTYLLHSTTFLGFGSNSAREAYLDLLLHKHKANNKWHKFVHWSKNLFGGCFHPKTNEHNGKDADDERFLVLDDPCLPKGFISDELKKPKELLESKSGKVLGYLLEDGEPSFSYKVRGTGSYNKCKKLVEEMLKLSKQERLNCKGEEQACTMELLGETFIPFESLDVLGIGDIYYTTNLMLRAAGTYNHRSVATKTKGICNTPFEVLKERFSSLFKDDKLKSRVSDECFKAVWVDTFLVKGLSMPTGLSMLRTVGQINNDDLEWTLGAVLDKSLAIEEATEEMSEQLMRAAESLTTAASATITTTTPDTEASALNEDADNGNEHQLGIADDQVVDTVL